MKLPRSNWDWKKIFELVRFCNKYFDEQQPWLQIKNDPETCKQTLAICVYLIANLAHILAPFLPFSSSKVKEMIHYREADWSPVLVHSKQLSNVEPLFERIDQARIAEELERLNKQLID